MKTIFVTDKPKKWQFLSDKIDIVSARQYISSAKIYSIPKYRIINVCKSYQYQRLGYYVSLLAEARGHKVYPSTLNIQDYKLNLVKAIVETELEQEIQKSLSHIKHDTFELSLYFGKNIASKYKKLSKKIYEIFPFPLFRVYFKFKKRWQVDKVKLLQLNDICESHQEFLQETTEDFINKKTIRQHHHQNYKFDLAILVNPDEKTPPSDKHALDKFITAAKKFKIHAEIIEPSDFKYISEYDALFIRETTEVNHHTYRFARQAMSQGLIVIDDPISILKCCNKVYLNEILEKHKIKTPLATVITKKNVEQVADSTKFPCVLKLPDSAFSLGVKKIESKEALIAQTTEMFTHSDLLLIQEFLPSEFDWRIGIINHVPIFACQYHMAKGHWQIYNWDSQTEKDGTFQTFKLDEVPEAVMQTALKASKLIGNSLYGVDIKVVNDVPYVIEINDNPSIEKGVEDKIAGDNLYSSIMEVFFDRLMASRGL